MSEAVSVIGIDPSLSATGISNGVRHDTITTGAEGSLEQRCTILENRLLLFMPDSARQTWVIEAPMLRVPAHGGSHLYEIGHVMRSIYYLARYMRNDCRAVVDIIEVSNGALKRWAFGKASLDKAHVALACYKKWGVEFEHDRGVDQAHAFMLHKYGCAVVAGEIEHHAAAERGSGKRAKATARKRKREAHAA